MTSRIGSPDTQAEILGTQLVDGDLFRLGAPRPGQVGQDEFKRRAPRYHFCFRISQTCLPRRLFRMQLVKQLGNESRIVRLHAAPVCGGHRDFPEPQCLARAEPHYRSTPIPVDASSMNAASPHAGGARNLPRSARSRMASRKCADPVDRASLCGTWDSGSAVDANGLGRSSPRKAGTAPSETRNGQGGRRMWRVIASRSNTSLVRRSTLGERIIAVRRPQPRATNTSATSRAPIAFRRANLESSP